MNNIYKNKMFYILNIIVKTGTLNFYCLYLSIKKLSCKCVRYNKHGIKIEQNLSTEARHRICNCYDITSQHLVIINNYPKVVHPGRLSSPRFAFETQSPSFCILWCITNFTIAPCTTQGFRRILYGTVNCSKL